MNTGHPGLDAQDTPTPLHEARLIVPMFDNHGRDLIPLLRWVEESLITDFGGCTVLRQVFGAWRDPATGDLYREPVYVFDVAVPDTDHSAAQLRNIARKAATRGEQQSVYLRLPSGAVEFVKPAHDKPVVFERIQ